MNILRELIGPKSKYDKTLPYTYEARIPIIEGVEKYNCYLSDTICGLIEYLEKNEFKPGDTKIYEVFLNGEKMIEQCFYTNKEGTWLHKPELCLSLSEHYKGHIHEGRCSFKDRERTGIGP